MSGQPRYTIKEWPSSERPRERLQGLGAGALSARELLAILIGTGSTLENGRRRSAVDLAGDLLRSFSDGGGSLRPIATSSVPELCKVPGIGPAKAAKLLAALELGRRAAAEQRPGRDTVRSARQVYERMRLPLRDLPQEEFHVLLLNTRNEVLRDLQVSRGTLDASLVHPREVFRAAVAEAAAAVILVHNHPSGDPSPSAEDREITSKLRRAGEHLGVEVLDHVIVGADRFTSFVEAGLLE
ncbi:MAG: RadC family protein [Longimicrobiaceae bacterium]